MVNTFDFGSAIALWTLSGVVIFNERRVVPFDEGVPLVGCATQTALSTTCTYKYVPENVHLSEKMRASPRARRGNGANKLFD